MPKKKKDPEHEMKTIQVIKEIEVDIGIADLVQEMNKAGIETLFSCEGNGRNDAYITIQTGRNLYFDYNVESGKLTLRWCREKQQTSVFNMISNNGQCIDADKIRLKYKTEITLEGKNVRR